jgi:glutathione peroxidase
VNVHDFTVEAADGDKVNLADYSGKVLLVVNVASKCGLTPQYEGLQALHEEFKDQGLQIIGFPCNQFGGQEPGTADEIADFCSTNYAVTFPLMAKIDVNGDDAAPLYKYLRSEAPGEFGPEDRLYPHLQKSYPEYLDNDSIKWNFSKFLVDRDGNVVKRYQPTVLPSEIRDELSAVLG